MRRPLLFLLGIWILGECAAWLAGVSLVPDTALDTWMTGRDSARLVVSGRVRQIRHTASGCSYVLGDILAETPEGNLTGREVLVFAEEGTGLVMGSELEVTGLLAPFEPPGNPGQFDLAGYYRAQGIDYQLEESSRRLRSGQMNPLGQGLHLLRTALEEALDALEPPERAGVLESMLLGDRSQLTLEVRGEYRDASLAHLLSISGLHVSLFGMGLNRILRRLGAPKGLRLPASAALAAAYVRMTGGSASARRALILLLFYLGAEALGRTYDMLSALGAAGLLLLWDSPLLLFQNGFQLSFLAVLGVGALRPLLSGWLALSEGKRNSLLLTLSVQWAVWPVLSCMNGVIPLCGLWVGLLTLPLTAPLLLLGGAGAALGAAGSPAAPVVLRPAEWILSWFQAISRVSARLPGQNLVTGCPLWWQPLLYAAVLGGALCTFYHRLRIAERRRRKRQERRLPPEEEKVLTKAGKRLILLGVSVLLLFCLRRPPVRGLQITCIDVGQGNSVLVRSDAGCVLVDGGSSQVKAVGENRILPYLHHEGIGSLEAVVLTHADADHINGVGALLRSSSLRVKALCLTEAERKDPAVEELRELALERGTELRLLRAGESWDMGETAFTCLYPEEQDCGDFAEDINNTSAVLEVRGEGVKALLMGDLGLPGEERMKKRGKIPRTDILVVGHHGSRYSSGEPFLALARPSLGLISCGRRNRYGHPHPEVLERLEEIGCLPLTTAEGGALSVLARGGTWRVYRFLPERAVSRRT